MVLKLQVSNVARSIQAELKDLSEAVGQRIRGGTALTNPGDVRFATTEPVQENISGQTSFFGRSYSPEIEPSLAAAGRAEDHPSRIQGHGTPVRQQIEQTPHRDSANCEVLKFSLGASADNDRCARDAKTHKNESALPAVHHKGPKSVTGSACSSTVGHAVCKSGQTNRLEESPCLSDCPEPPTVESSMLDCPPLPLRETT